MTRLLNQEQSARTILNNVPNGFTASRLTTEKKKIGKFQILSCLVANAVTTVFHTDTKNKDIWLRSQ